MSDHTWSDPGVFEVAPGVHRIPLPLPNDGLHAVNVYAISDGDGLVLIDSGWALAQARTQLESALGEIGHDFGSIRRFLVTHAHRDHYTMAIALRREFGAKVALGIGEQPTIEAIRAGAIDMQVKDLIRWGAQELMIKLAEAFGDTPNEKAQRAYELPDEWITGAVDIELDQRTLHALPTPGHTQGHVVFQEPKAGLLFSGDHVLPHITPSIGFETVRGELPLGDYMDSLRLVRSHPDMRLLPAHGPVTASVHARVEELLDFHEERLVTTKQAIADGAGTAFEAAHKLGWTRRQRRFDDLDVFNQLLATGETSAHLDVLVHRGELTTSTVDDVVEYKLCQG